MVTLASSWPLVAWLEQHVSLLALVPWLGPARQALLLIIALLCGGLVVVPFVSKPRGAALYAVVHDPKQQRVFRSALSRATRHRRLPWRLRAHLRRRLARGGLGHVPLGYVLALTLACGLGGAGLAQLLLPAGPFVLLCGLGGCVVPWLGIERRAQARSRAINAQVVDLLWIMVSAIVNGETVVGALLEAAEQGMRAPLRAPLRRALDDLIPARGVARPLLDVLATLEQDLASPAFTLAERTIAAHQRASNVSLAESLERVAGLAQEEMTDAAETRGDFALGAATATFMFFIMPLVVTLVLHWVLPTAVEAAYQGPLGWGVAAGLIAWCVCGYRISTAAERAALAGGLL